MERETLKPAEVAKMLGISAQAVREQLKAKLLPYGEAIPNARGTGYRYLIYKDKFYRHIGKIPPESNAAEVTEMLQGLLGRLVVLTETQGGGNRG